MHRENDDDRARKTSKDMEKRLERKKEKKALMESGMGEEDAEEEVLREREAHDQEHLDAEQRLMSSSASRKGETRLKSLSHELHDDLALRVKIRNRHKKVKKPFEVTKSTDAWGSQGRCKQRRFGLCPHT